MHRGLDRLDTLASLRDGLIERGLEPLIGFEQRMPIIRRGDTGAGCQLAPVRWAQDAGRGHAQSVAMPSALSTCGPKVTDANLPQLPASPQPRKLRKTLEEADVAATYAERPALIAEKLSQCIECELFHTALRPFGIV